MEIILAFVVFTVVCKLNCYQCTRAANTECSINSSGDFYLGRPSDSNLHHAYQEGRQGDGPVPRCCQPWVGNKKVVF